MKVIIFQLAFNVIFLVFLGIFEIKSFSEVKTKIFLQAQKSQKLVFVPSFYQIYKICGFFQLYLLLKKSDHHFFDHLTKFVCLLTPKLRQIIIGNENSKKSEKSFRTNFKKIYYEGFTSAFFKKSFILRFESIHDAKIQENTEFLYPFQMSSTKQMIR